MKKTVKITFTCLFIYLLLALCGTNAFAAGGNLPDSFCIDDENGISVQGDGQYFLYMDQIMPGDTVTRKLTLRNLEQGLPIRLDFSNQPLETAGAIDWLDNLHMTVTYNGNLIYAGRVRGDGADTRTMKGNGVNLNDAAYPLGVYKMGDYGVLEFSITADGGHLTWADYKDPSAAKTRFIFTAVKETGDPAEPTGPKNPERSKDGPKDGPKTGEIVTYGSYLLFLLLIILSAVFYYRYRKLKGNS